MHWCRSYCLNNGIQVTRDRNEGSHQAIINTLESTGVSSLRAASHCLRTLKEFRVQADYELSDNIPEALLSRTLTISENLRAKLGIA